jgi:GNAT superfamily N-acetyltransferase
MVRAMKWRFRQASPTDAPVLMHIERACRLDDAFLSMEQRLAHAPRLWRAWFQCAPPFDRHPSVRRGFIAYEHNDIFGFIACAHDSMYAGYRADVAGLYVLPRYRRAGIGQTLFAEAARWLAADGITRMTMTGYARSAVRPFGERLGGFVIQSVADEADPAALITFGFSNLSELARE